MNVNVANSGIMHIRRKKAERCNVTYKLDGETIPMVSSYKYLGCVVDEFLELKEMVEDKAEAGRRALGACFQRCRAEMVDVTVRIFRKLMESLVESTMMYGAEVWGCSRHLVPIEQVQLRAPRMFFGVGTLHPKASLLLEINSLPVVWEAKMHCVKFWLKVLTSRLYEGRLLKKIARRAVECGKGVWIKNMAKCVGDFEWQSVGGDAIANLTGSEIGAMLSCAAWRKARSMLMKEVEERPKLRLMKEIVNLECESSCAVVKRKKDRTMLMKLRGGTVPFQIEVVRWQGVDKEERICKECQCQEVEDVFRWLIQCPAWNHLRQPLMSEANHWDRFKGQSHSEQTAIVLSLACADPRILKHLSSMQCAVLVYKHMLFCPRSQVCSFLSPVELSPVVILCSSAALDILCPSTILVRCTLIIMID